MSEPILELCHQSELLRILVSTFPQAVLVLNSDQQVMCWNPMAEKIFGVTKSEALSKPVDQLLAVESLSPLRFAEEQPRKNSDSKIQIEQAVHSVTFETDPWTIVYLNDVTDRREYERRLANEALTDPLSGLSNRRGFQIKLESSLSSKLTLAIVDTDHFKQINDRFGHESGDLAIQLIANELKNCFPDAICHARLGGDEFGLMINTLSHAETERRFESFRQQICDTKIGGPSSELPEFSISVSIGVAMSDVGGTTARELLTTADRSMYKAKKGGRNQIYIQPIDVDA